MSDRHTQLRAPLFMQALRFAVGCEQRTAQHPTACAHVAALSAHVSPEPLVGAGNALQRTQQPALCSALTTTQLAHLTTQINPVLLSPLPPFPLSLYPLQFTLD